MHRGVWSANTVMMLGAAMTASSVVAHVLCIFSAGCFLYLATASEPRNG